MTNSKNREELDEYKELNSSKEERLQDNQPSTTEAQNKEECEKEGGVWNPQTRQCEKGFDPDRDLDLESELDTQTELSSSEEERLQGNQLRAASEAGRCPPGEVWNPQTRQCEKSSDSGGR
jgi:hypothetical protein